MKYIFYLSILLSFLFLGGFVVTAASSSATTSTGGSGATATATSGNAQASAQAGEVKVESSSQSGQADADTASINNGQASSQAENNGQISASSSYSPTNTVNQASTLSANQPQTANSKLTPQTGGGEEKKDDLELDKKFEDLSEKDVVAQAIKTPTKEENGSNLAVKLKRANSLLLTNLILLVVILLNQIALLFLNYRKYKNGLIVQ